MNMKDRKEGYNRKTGEGEEKREMLQLYYNLKKKINDTISKNFKY